jgi:hypothetical protein
MFTRGFTGGRGGMPIQAAMALFADIMASLPGAVGMQLAPGMFEPGPIVSGSCSTVSR